MKALCEKTVAGNEKYPNTQGPKYPSKHQCPRTNDQGMTQHPSPKSVFIRVHPWLKLCFVAALAFTTTVAFVADPLSENLQKGLFEEEANHNIEAAIKAY